MQGSSRLAKRGGSATTAWTPTAWRRCADALQVFWTHELEQLATARPPTQGEQTMTAEVSVLVPLGPEETFALLTEPERLRRWQAVTARVELRAGGEYRWTIVPGHTAAGTITELEPGKRIVFSFGWEDSDDLPPGASTVTITLEPAEGGTNVHLVHSGLTPEQAAGHQEGWDHYARAARGGGHCRRRRRGRMGGGGADRPADRRRGVPRSLPAGAARAAARATAAPRPRVSSSPSTTSSTISSARSARSAGRPARTCRMLATAARRGSPGPPR